MNEKRFSRIGISRSKMFAWIKDMVDDDDGYFPPLADLPAWCDILPAAARPEALEDSCTGCDMADVTKSRRPDDS